MNKMTKLILARLASPSLNRETVKMIVVTTFVGAFVGASAAFLYEQNDEGQEKTQEVGSQEVGQLEDFEMTCPTASAIEIAPLDSKKSWACQVDHATQCVRFGGISTQTSTGLQYGNPTNCRGGWTFSVNSQRAWCRGETADTVIDCVRGK